MLRSSPHARPPLRHTAVRSPPTASLRLRPPSASTHRSLARLRRRAWTCNPVAAPFVQGRRLILSAARPRVALRVRSRRRPGVSSGASTVRSRDSRSLGRCLRFGLVVAITASSTSSPSLTFAPRGLFVPLTGVLLLGSARLTWRHTSRAAPFGAAVTRALDRSVTALGTFFAIALWARCAPHASARFSRTFVLVLCGGWAHPWLAGGCPRLQTSKTSPEAGAQAFASRRAWARPSVPNRRLAARSRTPVRRGSDVRSSSTPATPVHSADPSRALGKRGWTTISSDVQATAPIGDLRRRGHVTGFSKRTRPAGSVRRRGRNYG